GFQHTALRVHPIDDGFVLTGAYAGYESALIVRPNRIAGRIGTCRYELASQGNDGSFYAGPVSANCWRSGQAELLISDNVGSLPPKDRAIVMALFLGTPKGWLQ